MGLVRRTRSGAAWAAEKLARRAARRTVAAAKALVEARVGVTEERQAELLGLLAESKEQVQPSTPVKPALCDLKLAAFDLPPDTVARLRKSLGCGVAEYATATGSDAGGSDGVAGAGGGDVQPAPSDSPDSASGGPVPAASSAAAAEQRRGWAALRRALGAALRETDAVLLGVDGRALTPQQEYVVAAAFLAGKPVLAVAPASSASGGGGGGGGGDGGARGALDAAAALTGGTWPAFAGVDRLEEWLAARLPGVAALTSAIRAQLDPRVERHRRFNKTKHFATRAAVAFIPLAVTTMSAASVLNLSRRMLADCGLLLGRGSRQAAGAATAAALGKTVALDTIGDAYQLVVCASILKGFADAASTDGVGAALEAMDLADLALLGSGMGVTGLVSAVSATLTRPALVEALLSLAVAQQLVWALNKGMRREEAAQGAQAAQGPAAARPAAAAGVSV